MWIPRIESKLEFQSGLHDTRVMVRGKDGPERTIDVSIGVAELGVIKGVESLKAELEALGFADLRVFQ